MNIEEQIPTKKTYGNREEIFMILKTESFKEVCSLILAATDSNEISTLTETLELVTEGRTLYLNVTNKEYYASVKFDLDHEEEFHATVNATLFLKLIAAVTSEAIELEMHDNYITVKANGNYKIPLIFENDKLMELPLITIENKTVEMNVAGSILQSILNYNSKELAIGSLAKPVQKMFYVDQEGCITFTTGACVNSFSLEKPIRILLNSRLVKLFKLFKDDMVKFTLGYDPISETIIQTKVSFATSKIKLTAVTGCDDSLLNQVPVGAIRNRANKAYPHSIVLSKDALVEAVNRLLLFSAGYGSKENVKPYSLFAFSEDKVTIYDSNKENIEVLKYANNTVVTTPYEMTIDLIDFKKVLDGCTEQFVTVNFGDGKACVIVRNAIKNVLPEVNVRTRPAVQPAQAE